MLRYSVSVALAILCGLLGWATSSDAAFVKKQEKSCVGSLVASTPCNVAGVVANSTLIAVCKLSIGGNCTPTSSGITWTQDISRTHTGLGWVLQVYSALIPAGGAVNTTFTSSGGATAIRIILTEFSGVATSSRVDATAASSGTGSAVSAGSVTTTAASELLVVGAGTDSDLLGWSPGAGYTFANPNCNVNIEPDQKVCMEYKTSGATGNYTGTLTINSDSWVAAMVAYRPTGGADTTPPAAPTGVQISQPVTPENLHFVGR